MRGEQVPDCPDHEQLIDFLKGELSSNVQLTLEQHIQSCADCQAMLDNICVEQERHLYPTDVQPNCLRISCPHCKNPIELIMDAKLADVDCPSCGSHFDPRKNETNIPLSKIGRFEIVEIIGKGAFGTVVKAQDTELDRTVAIKIPRQSHLSDHGLERFHREARAAAQLRHPNIVHVHDIEQEDGLTFIVSDFVDGPTLNRWLEDKNLTWMQIASLCSKIALALNHAHENGIIHRDLKPQNILVDGHGEPQLTDFGLAKRRVGEVTMTMEGDIFGTPAYMSPEQASGKIHLADPRTDIFSFGVLFYEMLTGILPFRGSTTVILNSIVHDDPVEPRRLNRDIPIDLETICLKCLENQTDRRYPTAADIVDELNRFGNSEPIHARPISRLEKSVRWCRRNKKVAFLSASVAALVIVLAIGGPILAWRNGTLFEESETKGERLRARTIELTRSRSELKKSNDEQRKRSAINKALLLATLSRQLLTDDPRTSLRLAIEAVESARRDGVYVPSAIEQLHLVMLQERSIATLGGGEQFDDVFTNRKWVVARKDSNAYCWDLESNWPPGSKLAMELNAEPIANLQPLNRDGLILISTKHGSASVWDLSQKHEVFRFKLPWSHSDTEVLAKVSEDRQYLAVAHGKNFGVWHFGQRQPLGINQIDWGEIESVEFVGDRKRLVCSIREIQRIALRSKIGYDPKIASRSLSFEFMIVDFDDQGLNLHPTICGKDHHFAARTTLNGKWIVTQDSGALALWNLMSEKPDHSSLRIESPFSEEGDFVFYSDSVIECDGRWLLMRNGYSCFAWNLNYEQVSSVRQYRGNSGKGRFWSKEDWLYWAPEPIHDLDSWAAEVKSSPLEIKRWDLNRKAANKSVSVSDEKLRRLYRSEFSSNPHWNRVVMQIHTGNDFHYSDSIDRQWTIGTGHDGILRVWNATRTDNVTLKNPLFEAQRGVILSMESNVGIHCLVFSKSGRWLVAASDDEGLICWDFAASNIASSRRCLIPPTGKESWVDWSFHFFDASTSGLARKGDESWYVNLIGSSPRVTVIDEDNRISRDKRWAAKFVGGTATIYQTTPQANLFQLQANKQFIQFELPKKVHVDPLVHRPWSRLNYRHYLKFTQDSKKFISANGQSVTVIDLESKLEHDQVHQLTIPEGLIESVICSPNGRWLLAQVGLNVWRWDLNKLRTEKDAMLLWKLTDPLEIAFHVDRAFLIGINGTKTLDGGSRFGPSKKIEATDLASRKQYSLGKLRNELASAIAVSPNGKWLADCDETRIRVWDATSVFSKPFVSFRGFNGQVSSAVFDPEGKVLATAHENGSIHIWYMDVDILLHQARKRSGRELNDEEREKFQIDQPLTTNHHPNPTAESVLHE